MKCTKCEDPKLFFSVMPDISNKIGWCSHPLVEVNGKISLYHYECGKVNVMSVYQMFKDLIEETGEKSVLI